MQRSVFVRTNILKNTRFLWWNPSHEVQFASGSSPAWWGEIQNGGPQQKRDGGTHHTSVRHSRGDARMGGRRRAPGPGPLRLTLRVAGPFRGLSGALVRVYTDSRCCEDSDRDSLADLAVGVRNSSRLHCRRSAAHIDWRASCKHSVRFSRTLFSTTDADGNLQSWGFGDLT